MQLFGVDFTSAPSRRKAIVVAGGRCSGAARLRLDSVIRLSQWTAFEQWLRQPGPWTAGFDFPFGLPRELLRALEWPCQDDDGQSGWSRSMTHIADLPRQQMVAQFKQFCDARPSGSKFAHRACDIPAGSSPSMKWVNPPVAFMLQAGVPRLVHAGVQIPGLHRGDPQRVALEAYPGLLARAIIGHTSYKSDDKRKQTNERRQRRVQIVAALKRGANPLSLHLEVCDSRIEHECVDDASGDTLDAVLCLMQATWGWFRRDAGYGFPDTVDPLEGWIVTAA